MRTTFLMLAAAPLFGFGDSFNTALGPVTISPMYHAGIMIEAEKRLIYIDPPAEANYQGRSKADLILITHGHRDHFDPPSIARISNKNTAIIAPQELVSGLKRATALDNGRTVQIGDMTVEAFPAYSAPRPDADPKTSHERGHGNGYILTWPGLRVYISGDTEAIPEMKSLKNIDVAFLSMGTPGTMTVEQAADAIRMIHPRIVYPYHYGKTSLDTMQQQLGNVAAGVEVRVRNWYE